MKITSKGQVTIPQAVREQARLLPHCEVEFEVRPIRGAKAAGQAGKEGGFEVIIKPVAMPTSSIRSAFESVRGSANAAQFKNMGTDEFMAYLRG
jgi:bifunctional DNA-binding transcriptional regulator/antitoxin component of YhaV-PrlF toxin-antitoxin module